MLGNTHYFVDDALVRVKVQRETGVASTFWSEMSENAFWSETDGLFLDEYARGSLCSFCANATLERVVSPILPFESEMDDRSPFFLRLCYGTLASEGRRSSTIT